jgi:hypothetical protein
MHAMQCMDRGCMCMRVAAMQVRSPYPFGLTRVLTDHHALSTSDISPDSCSTVCVSTRPTPTSTAGWHSCSCFRERQSRQCRECLQPKGPASESACDIASLLPRFTRQVTHIHHLPSLSNPLACTSGVHLSCVLGVPMRRTCGQIEDALND